jgi:Cu-Zn family superoxide dismutase
MNKHIWWHPLSLLVVVAFGSACAQPGVGRERGDLAVELKDQKGQAIGTAKLQQTSHGVLVRAELSNLPPGVHAFHIHETGKCDAPFTSAGGHLHAADTEHGFANPDGFHAGDLPNVHVAESGKATVEAFAPNVTFDEGNTRLLDEDGAALVLHAGADDYRTDPAGAAGDRIACGVIAK